MSEQGAHVSGQGSQDEPGARNSATPRVLFTSTDSWPFSARLASNLAKAGVDVSAVCLPGHVLLKTRAVRRKFGYSPVRPLQSVLDAIRTTVPQFIIPCDERAVEHLHRLHAEADRFGEDGSEIAGIIERSLGDSGSYPVVCSRHLLLQLAREEGIRVPETEPVRDMEILETWAKFPCVLKADGTWGGRGVRVAANAEQAKRTLQQLNRVFGFPRALKRMVVNHDPFWSPPWPRRSRPAIIIQRYIAGTPANCAVFCWRGQVLAGMAVEVLRAEGITKPATVVRLIDNAEMMRAAEQIASKLGLSGLFGLDFILEEASGAPCLIEMNPRPTPLCHLRLGQGRDLIGALVEELSGRAAPETPPVTTNDTIAYFPQALRESDEYLESCFLDAPHDEPELISALLPRHLGRSWLDWPRKRSQLIAVTGPGAAKDAVP